MSLPEPSAKARKNSKRLINLISAKIAEKGWISFAEYMNLALYAPELGYYGGGSVQFGKRGDFTTSPHISPLFAATTASFFAKILPQTGNRILELGAGDGTLAFNILSEMRKKNVSLGNYAILEISPALRERQQKTLRSFAEVTWIEKTPEKFSGIILANEVFDALPVHLIRKTENGWKEVGVNFENEKLAFSIRKCAKEVSDYIKNHLPHEDCFSLGYQTEVHPQACALLKDLALALKNGKGAMLIFDYGFPAHEYYFEQRIKGTLMCHFQKHAHDAPLFYPGTQDITAHVNFSALAKTVENDLNCVYMNQASFLVSCGITKILDEITQKNDAHYFAQANAVRTLLSPNEMGEIFKTFLAYNNIELPEEIKKADKSFRL